YREYAESWRRLHPAWNYEFWDAARCRALIADDYPSYLALYDRYRHRIQRVDAVRYFLLYRHGGVYLDMDIECLRPIDDLIAGKPSTRTCPTATFEPLAPREDVVVVPGAPVDLSQSYAIHHMSMHWLPRHHKVLFAAFDVFAKAYWRRRAKRGQKPRHQPP